MSRLFKPRIFFGAITVACAFLYCFSHFVLLGDGEGIGTILGLDVFYWHRLKAVMAASVVCCGVLWALFSLVVIGDFVANLFGIVFDRPIDITLSAIAFAAIVFMVVSGHSMSFLVAGLASDFGLVKIDQTALAEFTKVKPKIDKTKVEIDIAKRKEELEKLTAQMEEQKLKAGYEGKAQRLNEAEKFMDEVAVEWAKIEAQEKAQKQKMGY